MHVGLSVSAYTSWCIFLRQEFIQLLLRGNCNRTGGLSNFMRLERSNNGWRRVTQWLSAESYKNQSNSDFACHYAMFSVSDLSEPRSLCLRQRKPAKNKDFMRNCQLVTKRPLLVINQNVYILHFATVS